MGASLSDRIAHALNDGRTVVRTRALSGGCVGDVSLVELDDETRLVAKTGSADAKLDVEGRMIRYLAEVGHVPTPQVLHDAPDLLVMSYVESGPGDAEHDAADVLARLHSVSAHDAEGRAAYGLGWDTLIGGLTQTNNWTDSWTVFHGEQRLVLMAEQAQRAGRIDRALVTRVRALADRLHDFVPDDPGGPGGGRLIHGDVWSGNVLALNGKITALIDPAISYADPEFELAFITLFGTFGDAFFRRYTEARAEADDPWPDPEGFWRTRRDVYLLFPLLVHARLFGGSYVAQVSGVLSRLGF